MNIPTGVFFGGKTFNRDHSLQSAKRVFAQLKAGGMEVVPIFVDPFGQLILLEEGMPTAATISEFYPSDKYFSQAERDRFVVYPEQLGRLGATETQAMAQELGTLVPVEDLPQYISVAFLTLPDVADLQKKLQDLRIPYTGESADLFDLCADRYGLRLQIQQTGLELPPTLRLTTKDWQENSLQAIWGEDSTQVAYPLLLRPSHQYGSGRSSVVTAKDGPEGLRRAIDLAFGQKRLAVDDWLDMNPVTREDFVRRLANWSSGIGFPLELNTGEEKIVFQRPASLLDYLQQTDPEKAKATFIFKSQSAGEEILVSSLPEGTALSCLLLRGEDQSWQASNLRFIGPAPAIIAGTEGFPAPGGTTPKVSESLSGQVMDNCRQLAGSLPAATGIRIFGILSPQGTFFTEEIQPFSGPEPAEKISNEQLKNFVIASLQTRQAEKPEPVYRPILEALRSDPALLTQVSAGSVSTEKISPRYSPAAKAVETPATDTQQKTYERERRKLNKEKEAMPESTSFFEDKKTETSQKASSWWQTIKQFFTSKVFLRNLGAMALFLGIMFLLVNMALRVYTKHGDSMQLEDYQGLLLEDAQRKAAAKGLKMEVISTSFQPGQRANEIFAQYPEPLSNVKENRTVFVSIYQGKGKEIILPAFTDVGDDIDNYRRELGKRKIRLVVKDKKFAGKLAEGTILYLLVEGEKITNTQLRQDKVKVAQGETVEAVISTRVSNVVEMPNLICQTFDEAQFNLSARFLVIGKVYGGNADNRSNYYVWKQNPEYRPGKYISKGTQVDVYLIPTIPEECE